MNAKPSSDASRPLLKAINQLVGIIADAHHDIKLIKEMAKSNSATSFILDKFRAMFEYSIERCVFRRMINRLSHHVLPYLVTEYLISSAPQKRNFGHRPFFVKLPKGMAVLVATEQLLSA